MPVIMGSAALCAALALALAQLRFPLAADVLALAAAFCGLAGFVGAVVSTVRAARLGARSSPP